MPSFLSRREVRGVVLTYITYFLGTGILMPYFPIWLHDRGLSASDIALALSLPLFARIVATPVFTAVAQRFGTRFLGASLAGVALACVMIMQLYPPFWLIIFLAALGYTCWQSVALHFEPEAMNLVRRKLVPTYGVVRAFGSSAYIVAAVSGGAVMSLFGSTVVMFYFGLAAVLFIYFATRIVPTDRTVETDAPRHGPPIWRQPSLVLATVATALVMGTHSSFTSFGGLHMRQLGFPDALIGIILATMTVAELAMFAVGSRFVTRVPPVALIAIGAAAATFRWTAVSFVDSPAALMALQLLQSLTFAGTYLGFAGYVVRYVSPQQSVGAQGMYLGTFVAINGSVTLAVGNAYDHYGAHSFLILAAVPLVALALLGLRLVIERRRTPGERDGA